MIELIKEYFSNLDTYHVGSIILVVFGIVNNLIWFILRMKNSNKTESKHFLEKVSLYKKLFLNLLIWLLKLVDLFVPLKKVQNLIQKLRMIRDKVVVDGKSEHKTEEEGLKKIKELEEQDKIEENNQKVQLGG